MSIPYTEPFFMDPANPPPSGTPLTVKVLTVRVLSVVDADTNGFVSLNGQDSFGGSTITAVWLNDTIRVSISDVQVNTTGVTFYTADGRAVPSPMDGTVLQDAVFASSASVTVRTQIALDTFGPPCFVAGTLIRTTRGLVPVEALEVGDVVLTRDHGDQRIRRAGHRRMRGDGDLAPIPFAAGVFGTARPLLVSLLHRMLVTGWRAELVIIGAEFLVAAKNLVNGDTIRRFPVEWVDYHHILFDDHEMIAAEGLISESLHPGACILMADPGIRAEMLALFPDLNPVPGKGGGQTARRVIKAAEADMLDAPALCAA